MICGVSQGLWGWQQCRTAATAQPQNQTLREQSKCPSMPGEPSTRNWFNLSHTRKQGQPRTVSSQAKQWGKKGEKHAGQEGRLFNVALGMSLDRWQVPACSLLPETPIPASPPTPCAPDVTFIPAQPPHSRSQAAPRGEQRDRG